MKKLTLLITVLAVLYGVTGEAHAHPHLQYRLSEHHAEKMIGHMPIIEDAATRHELPIWLIAGIVYNESNAVEDVMGDGGRAYGLGQIHCGPGGFSWLKFLSKRKAIEKCADLLIPKKAVESIAHILVYLRDKESSRRELKWINVVTSYHKGEPWRKRKLGRAKQYFQAVRYFGRLFTEEIRDG